MSPLTVGVIGPAGFGGSYLCLELVSRGHKVIGFSRNPEKLGSHPLYTPHPLDVNAQSIRELADAFSGLDVLINEYGPHTAGHEALKYSLYSTDYILYWV
jgi:putative NADH-flavin reductase